MKELIYPTQLRDTDQMSINQTAHGFAVGNYVVYDKTTSSWKKANITGNYAVGSIGRVVDVESANSFEIKVFGIIVDYAGLTPGEFYYAKDDGTGGLTVTPPTNVIQAVLFALPGNKAVELSYPAVTPAATPSGNSPEGYNNILLSFTGSSLNYNGNTNVNGSGLKIIGSINITGVAGWRFIVSDSVGAVTTESIPPTEIILDTPQYTPNPTFNATLFGYYSSLNPTKRIIAIAYFDGTNIVKARPYGEGHKKNDDYWETNGSGVTATAAGTRLQYIGTWDKTWGTNIICVDNGAAVNYDDTEGFRVTFLKTGKAKIQVAIAMIDGLVSLHKNALLYKTYLAYNPSSPNAYMISIEGKVDANDYFTFVNAINSIGTALHSFTISFEEEN